MSNKQLRNFVGSLISVRASANDNSDGISIIEHKMPFGMAPPLHIHRNQDEVFHILRGRMRFQVGNASIIGHAGDILTVPKGIPHGFIVESIDGAHGLTITTGKDFETMVVEMSNPVMIDFLPALLEPTQMPVEQLTAACNRNHIEIIGPPLQDIAA
jgi:quercetin dioxygenase-like cupin family protein